mmetsp:Transcript_8467/g.19208  ORF Transcript_8467/g.19208 Transcript_8467/m.19208 type:complete len:230 (-) Transcript_8467:388-1077(-)
MMGNHNNKTERSKAKCNDKTTVSVNRAKRFLSFDSTCPHAPQRRRPLKSQGLARIVKPVLRILHGMNIEQHRQSATVRPIQEIVDIIQRAIKTTDIRTVGLIHVITHGQAQTVDGARSGQCLNDFFRDPAIPMIAQLLVGLLGAQNLAERVSVECRAVFSTAQELIKQTGSDPRFQHHPTAQIDAANLIVKGPGVLVGRARHGFVVCDKMTKGSGIGVVLRCCSIGVVL